MKKTAKKWIALSLSLCLVFALFGCTPNAKPTEPQNPSSSQQKNYPDYLNLDSFRPIVKEGEEITLKAIVLREPEAHTDINDQWFVQFIKEKLNVNLEIEVVTDENRKERKTMMLASNDLPDLILGLPFSNDEIVKYGVDEGQLLPISDYLSEELTPNILRAYEEYPVAKAALTASDGKMYSLSPLDTSTRTGFGSTLGCARVWIDTAYMDAAGITEVPTNLDDFVDMLRAFKALDPEKMGVEEIWPMVSVSRLEHLIFLSAFGWVTSSQSTCTKPAWDIDENKVVVPCLTEEYAEYIKLYRTFYEEGLIHPDYFTMDSTAATALMAARQAGVVGNWAHFLATPDDWEEFVSTRAMTSEWCDTPNMVESQNFQYGMNMISADTEYPELCLRLLDYMYSEEGSLYCTYGPPKGSEDTLGLVEGFTLDESNRRVYKEVTSGECESEYDYQCNKICINGQTPRIYDYADLYGQKVSGVKDPAFRELDLSNSDDHYRYLLTEAYKGCVVPALPDYYADPDTTVKLNDLKTVLENYADAEFAKFVVGQRPIEEVDELLDELMEMGGDEYLEIIQGLYKNYTR